MKGFRFVALLLALTLCMGGMSALAEADQPYAGTTITVYNWYDYIDPTVIDMFTEKTGINVQYVNFTTNEEMYTKLEAGAGSYDVLFPSDYIIERMIANDELAPLDLSAMPNVAGLIDWLKTPDYDPEGAYSVPYMWGTVGILYNEEYVDEPITSWKSLFDPRYQDDVFMLKSVRDTIGVTLKMLGYSVNENSEKALNEVRDVLIKQKQDGIVQGYMVDEVKEKMISGEAAMAVMWSGDAMYAIMGNDSLKYVVPEEGSNVWVDGMCIPKNAQNPDAAHKFIDFLCRPDIAYRNFECIYYASPITAVQDMMSEEDLANPALNPSEEALSKCEFFHDITENLDYYNRIWIDILA